MTRKTRDQKNSWPILENSWNRNSVTVQRIYFVVWFAHRRCRAGRRPDFVRKIVQTEYKAELARALLRCSQFYPKTMQDPPRGSQLGLCEWTNLVPRRGTSCDDKASRQSSSSRHFYFMTLWPSCEDLRPSCMVFHTNSFFEALRVFDAIRWTVTKFLEFL